MNDRCEHCDHELELWCGDEWVCPDCEELDHMDWSTLGDIVERYAKRVKMQSDDYSAKDMLIDLQMDYKRAIDLRDLRSYRRR